MAQFCTTASRLPSGILKGAMKARKSLYYMKRNWGALNVSSRFFNPVYTNRDTIMGLYDHKTDDKLYHTKTLVTKILHRCGELYKLGIITQEQLEDSLNELEIPYEGIFII
jgi:hypothetical protein